MPCSVTRPCTGPRWSGHPLANRPTKNGHWVRDLESHNCRTTSLESAYRAHPERFVSNPHTTKNCRHAHDGYPLIGCSPTW
jgi:hypothetical protein